MAAVPSHVRCEYTSVEPPSSSAAMFTWRHERLFERSGTTPQPPVRRIRTTSAQVGISPQPAQTAAMFHAQQPFTVVAAW